VKNIKDDVATMQKIESLPDFNIFCKKAVYLSCQGRLERILKELLQLENE
jgi:hypothetical protein